MAYCLNPNCKYHKKYPDPPYNYEGRTPCEACGEYYIIHSNEEHDQAWDKLIKEELHHGR